MSFEPLNIPGQCGCAIPPMCVDCPIIVSCDIDLVLQPGQLQYCPNDCKFYFICAGNKMCLNPTYGNGLGLTTDCVLQVKLAQNSSLFFDSAGAIDIDCAKLAACCNLVTHPQLAQTVNLIYQYIESVRPMKCGGSKVTASDTVFTVGSLLDKAGNPIPCGANLVLASELPVYRKCDGSVINPDTDRLVTCDASPLRVIHRNPTASQSVGFCVGIEPTAWGGLGTGQQQAVIWRGRDGAFVSGAANTFGMNSGGYVQFSVTNTFATQALLKIKGILQPSVQHIGSNGLYTYDREVLFIAGIGKTLGVNPPGFGTGTTPVVPGWSWTHVISRGGGFSPVADNGSSPWVFPYTNYTAETSGPMEINEFLAPGQTVTYYGQWWAIMYNMGPGTYTLHGAMQIEYDLFADAGN